MKYTCWKHQSQVWIQWTLQVGFDLYFLRGRGRRWVMYAKRKSARKCSFLCILLLFFFIPQRCLAITTRQNDSRGRPLLAKSFGPGLGSLPPSAPWPFAVGDAVNSSSTHCSRRKYYLNLCRICTRRKKRSFYSPYLIFMLGILPHSFFLSQKAF